MPTAWRCHCKVGVGAPVAAALNVAVWPADTRVLPGFSKIVGAKPATPVPELVILPDPLPLRLAAPLVTVPKAFIATRRN